jgi:hypothetical protein
MLLCFVPIKLSAAALGRLDEAPPLDHASQEAGRGSKSSDWLTGHCERYFVQQFHTPMFTRCLPLCIVFIGFA